MECYTITEEEMCALLDKYPDVNPIKPLTSTLVYILPNKTLINTPQGSFILTSK